MNISDESPIFEIRFTAARRNSKEDTKPIYIISAVIARPLGPVVFDLASTVDKENGPLCNDKTNDRLKEMLEGQVSIEGHFIEMSSDLQQLSYSIVTQINSKVIVKEYERWIKIIDSLQGLHWNHDFAIEKLNLVSSGRNPYFILEPGYELVLKDGDEQLTITVMDKTKHVDGVECRVVEEKETKGDKVVRYLNNYLAISKRTNSIFYFGEDSDESWLSGEDGGEFGLFLPGMPQLGEMYYQKFAPVVRIDRAEIVSVSVNLKTPDGEFKNCLGVKESHLMQRTTEHKYYAPGIGLVQKGELNLVKHGMTIK